MWRRAALSGDVIKELELEAKERQQRAAQNTNEKRYGGGSLPQISAEATLQNDLEPYYPERRRVDSTPAPAKATTHTAKTEPADKKNDG